MDENSVQNTSGQETIPAEMETQQEVETNAALDTAPQGEQTSEDTSAQDTDGNQNGSEENGTQPPTPFLEIQYNHEKKGLSRDEAITLAQKGMHYQSTYDSLERVATLKGQSVKEFLSGLETAQDYAYRQGLVEKFGDDEETIGQMMELYNINKQKTLDSAREYRNAEVLKEEQSINERLANEFVEMKNSDFPELTEFKDLPEEVKKAAFSGMLLSHAYLKYMHNENKKIAAAKSQSEAAAKKSTGSLGGSYEEGGNSFERGFLQGLWSKTNIII